MHKENELKKRRNRREWIEHIDSWSKSGLTQADYCTRNNLNTCSFSSWKKKIEEEKKEYSFIEISTKLGQQFEANEYVEFIMGSVHLRFPESIDPVKLRNIVVALSGV
jgi:hypothetical protein